MSTRSLILMALTALSACDVDYGLHTTEDGVSEPILEHFDELPYAETYGPISDIDVLVVLDGSGSMADDLENVGRGMMQLRRDIHERANEYSITFITSDPSDLGPVGPLGRDDADIDYVMAPALLPITGQEKGFAAAYHFVHSHPNWFDAERDLLVFLISDEDEQSGLSADMFDEWLAQTKTGERQADVISIASMDSACSPDIGEKYIALAELRGNSVVDLCSADWADWLVDYSFLTGPTGETPEWGG